MGDAVLDGLLGALFQAQVAGQGFGHVFTDLQLAQVLQVGQAVEREDAVHEPVCMLHLTDGFGVFLLGKLVEAPMLVHAVVQEILVDGRELILQLRLQVGNGLYIAFHGELLRFM
ncbi:hypothetical protein D3C78_1619170 [compost metagenome]